ncbi:hypothetical protein FRB96_002071 [Tulasnella sp. 330]|nr:hypothetical protein FRB96_002071 [Tulasnella sp. 330]KAG8881727.1 hypothetical protein FRB97_009202 [Tulasnella sp. 331]KAG8887662.1 hypothetical protein FRB98_009224 [Tulasnella sp. 332]
MRSSSFLVALQAGCLTLAAPVTLGLGSHQRRDCLPGSIEAREADYYHRSKTGTADQRKAVEMCMRLTLPAPCPENRPRIPSAADIIPCDTEPQAPETNQIYLRLTLPDPGIHEGHRTPSLVDPSPFATYAKHHEDGAMASGSSGSNGTGPPEGGHPSGVNDSSAHEQDETQSKGEASDNRSAGQTNAARPHDPSTLSGGNNAGAGSTSSGEKTNQQGELGQGQAGTHEGAPSHNSSTAGAAPASNGAETGGGDSNGAFYAGANHAAHHSTGSPPSASSAPADDGGNSLINLKVHATALNEASPAPTDVANGPLLNVKVDAAALHRHDGSDTPTSNIDRLLSVKADVAKHPLGGAPPTGTPVDAVLGSDAVIHLAAGVGPLAGQQSSGSNQPSVDGVSNDFGKGPLLSGKVHAAALHAGSEGSSPISNDLDIAAGGSPDDHAINTTRPHPAAHGVIDPVRDATSGDSLSRDGLSSSVNQNAAPELHALINVKGSTPDRAANGPVRPGPPVDNATHAATLLKLKAAASPPS